MTEPYLVVCFGIVMYKVLSEHTTETEAEAELAKWKKLAAEDGGVAVLPLSHHCKPGDFDVRTQSDLDSLTRAILDSYPEQSRL